ncbi:MAG: acyltransferase [Planctomycetota bacterium]|nr:acyltransferase [Planctomycetota bacterium]
MSDASAQPAPPPRRLLSIDALRGLAALWVVAHHCAGSYVAPLRADHALLYALLYPLAMGYVGVNLFLVISGFCIHQKLAMTPADQPLRLRFGAFWARRFRRLYPPYLAMVAVGGALTLALALWQHNDYSTSRAAETWLTLRWDLLTHVLMLHLFFGAFAYGLLNGPLWSLALEEHLYVLYGGMIALRNRLGVAGMLGLVAVVSLAWRAACIWGLGESPTIVPLNIPANDALGLQQAPSRWLEWCLGAVAVEAIFGRTRLPAWCRSRVVAAAALAAALTTTYTPMGWLLADPLWGLGWFTLIGALASREAAGRAADDYRPARLTRTLAWFGRFSYSIYLVHAPVLAVAKFLAYNRGHLPESKGVLLFQVTAGLASIPLAYLFHVAVERRFMASNPTPAARPDQSAPLNAEPHIPLPLSMTDGAVSLRRKHAA